VIHRVDGKVDADTNQRRSEGERDAAIKKISGKLEKEASEKGKYRVNVKSFYDNNEFYMFVYMVYKDVRLVGAPPSSIGKAISPLLRSTLCQGKSCLSVRECSILTTCLAPFG
jgi:hypothetical protein